MEDLRKDALSGVTVGTLLIPQGMAYAMLAGLPPIAGLYAAMVPLLLYPIFGTSRQLSIGPVAMDSLLVAAGVGALAESGTDQYWALAILLAVMVGIIQIVLGLLRLGFLVNFLSQPLISGFTSAAAIIISLSQIKHLFRIDFQGSQQVHVVVDRLLGEVDELHVTSLLLGIGCIVLLIAIGKLRPKWPGALIVIVASVMAVFLLDLEAAGVVIVGEVPQGLPSLQWPRIDWGVVQQLLPVAFTIALISFMEGIAIAKKFAAQEGDTVNANQELLAIGVANSAAGLFGGYPIAGSFSRTAISKDSGVRTPAASFFNAITVALTLLFLTPLFYYLPIAALASIVIVAVVKLIDFKEPVRLFRLRKIDFLVAVFSFVMTLLLGAQKGIFFGAVASIILIIRRISYPNVAILGRIGDTHQFRNVSVMPEAKEIEGFLFFRIDASLYYTNANYMMDNIMSALSKRKEVHTFVFDLSSVNEIDATAIATLFELVDDLKDMGIQTSFARIKAPVREIIEKSGFKEYVGAKYFLADNLDALRL